MDTALTGIAVLLAAFVGAIVWRAIVIDIRSIWLICDSCGGKTRRMRLFGLPIAQRCGECGADALHPYKLFPKPFPHLVRIEK